MENTLRLIDSYYRHSYLRNKILEIKSRKSIKEFGSKNRRFVIFLVPGANIVNGGILSIFSIASETQKLMAMSHVSVAVCTAYSEPRILRYTKFKNDIDIFAFTDLLQQIPSGSEVLVHVPELSVQKYVCAHSFLYHSRLDLKWRFNILLQNIDLIPPKQAVEFLQMIGPTTATIAHKAYATPETAQRLGCPVHYLSWWVYPERFERVGYSKKRKLIAISPDLHPARSEIIRRISETLPDHKIIEIRNMTYQKFRNIIQYAKFSFTFGEGLDGYFVEQIFCGGIGMAIFNDRFFTDEYRNFDGVFLNGEDAIMGIANFIKMTNNGIQYQAVSERQYNLLARNFRREEYLKNIRVFYKIYFPGWCLSE
jgi:hypothetical protein